MHAHALHCNLWPAPVYNIFPHYLLNDTILKKSYWTQNVCFDFLYKFCLKSSHSKKKWERYGHKCIMVFTESTRYSCQILTKLEFSRPFPKNTLIEFHENPFSGSRVMYSVPSRRQKQKSNDKASNQSRPNPL